MFTVFNSTVLDFLTGKETRYEHDSPLVLGLVYRVCCNHSLAFHMRITLEQIMAAAERDDNTGFCRACGAEQSGCEPDARNYECESCGKKQVFGAEELLIMNVG